MADKERTEDLKKDMVNVVSCGVTWIDGGVTFKPGTKHAKAWYGICHYSRRVWAITPSDYLEPTMITQILVDPDMFLCERRKVCLCKTCPLCRFDKGEFMLMFAGRMDSLGLPRDIGEREYWFNDKDDKYVAFFDKLILEETGGRIEVKTDAE